MTYEQDRRYAAWLSGPGFAAAEIVAGLGYGAVVLDIEHGTFDLADLDRFIPFLRGLNLEALAKVLGPERGPIQQALDFGATAVVVPHIENAAHAAAVCAFGKFPPLGDRSFAGGRTARYGGHDDGWIERQDRETRVYPMIEDAFADLRIVADAARAVGKPWVLPAWSTSEKAFALENGADQLVLTVTPPLPEGSGFSPRLRGRRRPSPDRCPKAQAPSYPQEATVSEVLPLNARALADLPLPTPPSPEGDRPLRRL
ncbi:aldolase/citrate lyase family protein [Nonomuraea sp. KM88]|uniref:aldolase/citrate lyase family protein n=1 Tax=Nonomuraea sp. KM88 TaxID=3457427 RepID=UPI003FCE52F4